MTLEEIRAQINDIDDRLAALFVRRMEAAGEVARIKAENGAPVYHPAREQEVLARAEKNAGKYGAAARTLFAVMMDLSRAAQYEALCPDDALRRQLSDAPADSPAAHPDAVAACQGVPGAYSAIAAKRVFPQGELRFFPSWREVFDAVEAGNARFGVVPVENSSAGSVREVLALLGERDCFVAGETLLPVEHCLCAPAGAALSGVRRALSHPQALAQCAGFLSAHGIEPVGRGNTAEAAREAARENDPHTAAICSRNAAEIAGLSILREGVQDFGCNSTRFFIIARGLSLDPEGDRVSLLFDLPHVTGSLTRILSRFAAAGLNLTRLESIPIPDAPFEYRFCLDFTGSVREEATKSLLCALSADLPFFRFLGNYRAYPDAKGANFVHPLAL